MLFWKVVFCSAKERVSLAIFRGAKRNSPNQPIDSEVSLSRRLPEHRSGRLVVIDVSEELLPFVGVVGDVSTHGVEDL